MSVPSANAVTKFRFENSGAQLLDEGVATLGQSFAKGDIPPGSSVAASIGGTEIGLQMDVKSRWEDGSVKFAVLSVERPELAAGASADVVLSKMAAASAGPAVNLAAVSSVHSLVVELTPTGASSLGMSKITVDVLDALRKGLADGSASFWQKGELASQARVEVDLPGSMRLKFDVTAYKDGQMSVDAVFANDEAMTASGGRVGYAVLARLDGTDVIRETVSQGQYQSWHREMATSGVHGTVGLGDAGHGWLNIRQDVAYLEKAAAVPNYDQSIAISQNLLGKYAAAVTRADWDDPLAVHDVTQYMPLTGGRPDIGITTSSNAAWLMSGDIRAAEYALGQAETAGAVPWNMWDSAHDTWLNTANYKKLWSEAQTLGTVGDAASLGLTQPVLGPDQMDGWRPDLAHQPNLSTVPYLMTGERWMLDNQQAQAAASVVATYPGNREGDGLIVVQGGQIRASAWSLREVQNAAWLSPDGSAEKAYFQAVADANWKWLVSKIPEWTAKQGEAHGWVPGGSYGQTIASWQQDYFASTAISAAARGNADALTFLKWQANFLIGRFTHDDAGFDFHDGAAYGLMVAAPDPTGTRFTIDTAYKTWAEIGAAMTAAGLSSKGAWSGGNDYMQSALSTLAGLYQVLGSTEALDVYKKLLASTPPYVDQPTLGYTPNYAITIPDIYDVYMPPGVVPPTPTDPPEPPTTPGQPVSLRFGTGADTLVLKVSQDFWNGSAQYMISMNGQQVGGLFTAAALRSAGQSDTIIIKGDWGASSVLNLRYVNDAHGTTAAEDRNLYIDGMTLNGAKLKGYATDYLTNGVNSFSINKPIAPVSLSFGTGPDTLVLKVSQDFWQGSARYALSVDGQAIGGILSAAALKIYDQTDTITLKGNWASKITLSVSYLDNYGGTSDTADRNLYLQGVTLNGVDMQTSAAFLTNGTQSFSLIDQTSVLPSPVSAVLTNGNARVNTLQGGAGDDILQGKAGNDVLTGGDGADTFIFLKGDGQDRITDFQSGIDRILFKGIDPGALSASITTIDGVVGTKITYGDGTSSLFLTGVSKLTDGDLVFAGVQDPIKAASRTVSSDITLATSTKSVETAASTVSLSFGTGADTLVLKVSQDFWNGSAQYMISMNGQQVGGLFTAAALRSAGQSDTIIIKGDWGASSVLNLRYVNDAHGTTAAEDRNLYIDGMTLNGMELKGYATDYLTNGVNSFSINKPIAPVSLSFGTGPDTLVLKVSQDFWQGSARYALSVDGQAIGGILSAAALKTYDQTDTITLKGNWASKITLSVSYLNDYGGTSDTADRNLYLQGVTLNGVDMQTSAAFLTNGTQSFSLIDQASVLPSPVSAVLTNGNARDNALQGGAGDDILQGKAGNDVLTGGDGADTLIFLKGDGQDRITDFQSGIDRILFKGIDPGALSASTATIDGVVGTKITYGDGTSSLFLTGVSKLTDGDLVFA